jgi:hypothetical protein
MQVVVSSGHACYILVRYAELSSPKCRAGFWGFVLLVLLGNFVLAFCDGGICAGLVWQFHVLRTLLVLEKWNTYYNEHNCTIHWMPVITQFMDEPQLS